MKKIAFISGTVLAIASAPQLLAATGGTTTGLMFLAADAAHRATKVAFIGSAGVLAMRAIQNRSISSAS